MANRSFSACLPGLLLLAMTLLAIAASSSPAVSPLWPGLAGWLAALLLFRRLPWILACQTSVMLCVGLACLAWVLLNRLPVDLVRVVSANIHVLALLASVTFLRLITQPGSGDEARLPRGRKALVKTAWGLHLFASVINLSAIMIFGNRMEKGGKISRLQAILFSRAFSNGCYWSPFYVSVATALVYAPGADFITLALAGLPVALIGLLLTTWQLARDPDSAHACGYPLRLNALLVPLALSAAVIGLNKAFPAFPVLTLITALSLALTALALAARRGAAAPGLLAAHVVDDLPNMGRELALFLAAGVMSTGISAVLVGNGASLGLSAISPAVCGGLMAVAILVSLVGVHPIVTISILGGLLSNVDSNATLLGLCMMMMWGNSIVVSPFSGINLAIQGRFGPSAFSIMRWNAGYALAMLAACVLVLYAYTASFLAPA